MITQRQEGSKADAGNKGKVIEEELAGFIYINKLRSKLKVQKSKLQLKTKNF